MRKEELEVDCFVNYKNEWVRVIGIYPNNKARVIGDLGEEYACDVYNDLEPILITGSILELRLGFDKYRPKHLNPSPECPPVYGYCNRVCDCVPTLTHDSWEVRDLRTRQFVIVKYVHDLQIMMRVLGLNYCNSSI